jgi:hypothetical protein
MSSSDLTTCKDCGTELSKAAVEAGDTLFGGGEITMEELATSISEQVLRNDRNKAAGRQSFEDKLIVGTAISRFLGYHTEEAFAEAARHWGRPAPFRESACERIVQAQFCQAPNPNPERGLDGSSLHCTLDAHDADLLHCFTYPAVAPAGATTKGHPS